MGLTANDYQSQIQALLPPGPLWESLIDDPVFSGLLAALAEEFARVDTRASDLIEEADPRTTNELLTDWERALALPDSCVNVTQTLDERRQATHAHFIAKGGANKQYWIDLAESLGFVAIVNDSVQPHHWEIVITNFEVQRLSVGEGPGHQIGEALRRYQGNDLELECLVLRLRPAHTIVMFTYGATGNYSVTYSKEILDAQNR